MDKKIIKEEPDVPEKPKRTTPKAEEQIDLPRPKRFQRSARNRSNLKIQKISIRPSPVDWLAVIILGVTALAGIIYCGLLWRQIVLINQQISETIAQNEILREQLISNVAPILLTTTITPDKAREYFNERIAETGDESSKQALHYKEKLQNLDRRERSGLRFVVFVYNTSNRVALEIHTFIYDPIKNEFLPSDEYIANLSEDENYAAMIYSRETIAPLEKDFFKEYFSDRFGKNESASIIKSINNLNKKKFATILIYKDILNNAYINIRYFKLVDGDVVHLN